MPRARKPSQDWHYRKVSSMFMSQKDAVIPMNLRVYPGRHFHIVDLYSDSGPLDATCAFEQVVAIDLDLGMNPPEVKDWEPEGDYEWDLWWAYCGDDRVSNLIDVIRRKDAVEANWAAREQLIAQAWGLA